MHKIKIINEQESLVPTHIYIDNTEIQGVKSLEYFKAALDELPVFKFEVGGMPEVVEIGQADIQFQFSPHTMQDASKILRHSLVNDKEIYNAFLVGIASALKEIPAGTGLYDVAKAVADRIIGEE